jgi:hypothetical protein
MNNDHRSIPALEAELVRILTTLLLHSPDAYERIHAIVESIAEQQLKKDAVRIMKNGGPARLLH